MPTAKPQRLTDVPNVTSMFVGALNATLLFIHFIDAIERDGQNHRGMDHAVAVTDRP